MKSRNRKFTYKIAGTVLGSVDKHKDLNVTMTSDSKPRNVRQCLYLCFVYVSLCFKADKMLSFIVSIFKYKAGVIICSLYN